MLIKIAIFPIFSIFYQIFRENLGKNFENLEICTCRGLWGAPEAREFIKILVEKSRKTCNFLKILMEIFPFYENILEFYPIFRENLVKNIELCMSMGF